MPPDLPIDQELMLKKRARRRLVGAVALVLLMIIILPQVLQDRALLAQQEPVKITMPDTGKGVPEPAINKQLEQLPAVEAPAQQTAVAHETENSTMPQSDVKVTEAAPEPITKPSKPVATPAESIKQEPVPAKPATENKLVAKATESAQSEIKAPLKKDAFTVQVGVYSDAANVKRLQEQLKQAGFTTRTEKVKTPKGESLRLKAGSFDSRQEATVALTRIKELGLPGMVIGNE